MSLDLDTSNLFQVLPDEDGVKFSPFCNSLMSARLTGEQAVNLAAWLIVFADPDASQVMDAVREIQAARHSLDPLQNRRFEISQARE